MSKKTNKKTDSPEVEQTKVENTQPAYVQELLEKGAVVIFGRTEGELNDMLANIPSDINFTAGAIGYYISKGLYRIQLNLKK